MNKPSLSKKVKSATGKLSYRQGVFLAILFACLVGAAIIFTGGEDKKPKQQAKPNAATVIVAKQDIPSHTIIRESMLKNVQVDSSMKPAGAVENVKDIVGKPTGVTIMSGDVITKSKVLTDPKMSGFVGMIPNDCRAISVPISNITGVGGFAKPGDYVDVMIINGKGNSGINGEIVFQNVLLLAVNKNGTQTTNSSAPANTEEKKDEKSDEGNDEKKDGKDKKESNKNASGANAPKESMAIATLALTPEEALKLAVQSREGTVYLALRPVRPSETFALDTQYFKPGKNEQAAAPTPAPATNSAPPTYYPPVQSNAPKAAATPAAPAQKGSNVTVFRGTKKTVE